MSLVTQRYKEDMSNTILSISYALMAEITYIGTSPIVGAS